MIDQRDVIIFKVEDILKADPDRNGHSLIYSPDREALPTAYVERVAPRQRAGRFLGADGFSKIILGEVSEPRRWRGMRAGRVMMTYLMDVDSERQLWLPRPPYGKSIEVGDEPLSAIGATNEPTVQEGWLVAWLALQDGQDEAGRAAQDELFDEAQVLLARQQVLEPLRTGLTLVR